MKTKISIIFISLATMIIFSSCATILGGSRKGVRVKGEPPHAQVFYNGEYIGIAPKTVKVPKSAHQGTSKVTVKANNYNPVDINLTRKWSTGYTVLDVLTGIVPLAIDAATGNIYQPKPNKITYKLDKKTNVIFKIGDKVILTSKKYKGINGVVTYVDNDVVKIKFTRPATLVEKETKKVDKITEEKDFYYNEIKLQ